MYKYNKYHLLYYYYSLCIFLTSKVKFKTPIENLDLDTGDNPFLRLVRHRGSATSHLEITHTFPKSRHLEVLQNP